MSHFGPPFTGHNEATLSRRTSLDFRNGNMSSAQNSIHADGAPMSMDSPHNRRTSGPYPVPTREFAGRGTFVGSPPKRKSEYPYIQSQHSTEANVQCSQTRRMSLASSTHMARARPALHANSLMIWIPSRRTRHANTSPRYEEWPGILSELGS